jgi:CRP-like cAMP-binding protein
MFIQQSDLFHGMDRNFVKEVMDIAIKEAYEGGSLIFSEGDPANYFFVLLKGQIKLSLGETGQVIHVVSHAGEAFGWSSLVGREAYSASAECLAPTNLLKMDREKLQAIIDKDPANGVIFFKHLAGTLGNRLLQSYRIAFSISQAEVSPSLGTGQVLESPEVL